MELRDAAGTEGRTELALRRSLARRREMWLTWSTSPSENARRQRLSVSMISGGAVVQQEDPDHIAASDLARACRRRRTFVGPLRDRMRVGHKY